MSYTYSTVVIFSSYLFMSDYCCWVPDSTVVIFRSYLCIYFCCYFGRLLLLQTLVTLICLYHFCRLLVQNLFTLVCLFHFCRLLLQNLLHLFISLLQTTTTEFVTLVYFTFADYYYRICYTCLFHFCRLLLQNLLHLFISLSQATTARLGQLLPPLVGRVNTQTRHAALPASAAPRVTTARSTPVIPSPARKATGAARGSHCLTSTPVCVAPSTTSPEPLTTPTASPALLGQCDSSVLLVMCLCKACSCLKGKQSKAASWLENVETACIIILLSAGCIWFFCQQKKLCTYFCLQAFFGFSVSGIWKKYLFAFF